MSGRDEAAAACDGASHTWDHHCHHGSQTPSHHTSSRSTSSAFGRFLLLHTPLSLPRFAALNTQCILSATSPEVLWREVATTMNPVFAERE